jgi:hypothetical protein
VYTKLHTNFCSDAFRHLLMPSSGSQCMVLFSAHPQSDFISSKEWLYKHLLNSRCKIVVYNHSFTAVQLWRNQRWRSSVIRMCSKMIRSSNIKEHLISVTLNMAHVENVDAVASRISVLTYIYRYTPHNCVSDNDRPHIRGRSQTIILQYNIVLQYHCVTTAYSIQYSNMLYRFVAQEQQAIPYSLGE